MRIRILIVDDEESICDILKYNLELEGYDVDYALSGEEALKMDVASYSLFILDIMMDKMSGIELAKRLKNNIATENTPIIFCTALSDEDNTVMGLNIGADDYVTKPFVINEVLARVRAVLRRANISRQFAHTMVREPEQQDISYKSLRIDRNEKACYLGEDQLMLTKTEFEILLFFLTHPNRIYSREEIIHEVWPEDVVVSNRTIDTNITRLRKKIEPYSNNIVTRLGFGYGFKETD
jgi:two-component system phosphate regulon response regulator PhoB